MNELKTEESKKFSPVTDEMKKYSPVFITMLALVFLIDITDWPGGEAERFLLCTYAKAAEMFYGVRHYYIAGEGYAELNGSYIIGGECLGIKFTAMLFSVCAVSFLKYFKGARKALWVALCLPCAAVIGYTANAVRILGSVPFAGGERFGLLHTSSGILIYLFLLTFIFTALRKHFERTTAL